MELCPALATPCWASWEGDLACWGSVCSSVKWPWCFRPLAAVVGLAVPFGGCWWCVRGRPGLLPWASMTPSTLFSHVCSLASPATRLDPGGQGPFVLVFCCSPVLDAECPDIY